MAWANPDTATITRPNKPETSPVKGNEGLGSILLTLLKWWFIVSLVSVTLRKAILPFLATL